MNTESTHDLARPITPERCRALHFGPWMIEPGWFSSAVDSVRNGTLKARGETVAMEDDGDPRPPPKPYQLAAGVAVIAIEGALMKPRSKYGGTSTVDIRGAIRKAVADPAVTAILLGIDSPGGTVAGTEALAQDVKWADGQKPVYAHIADMGASAAYYVASQARRITAEKTSLVGSLGVMMTVVDSSEAAGKAGFKVINLTTGGMKGAGTDGTEVTDEQRRYFQKVVDTMGEHFRAAVKAGRRMTDAQVAALFDGRVHDADQAKQLGLVDEVSSVDAALRAIIKETSSMNAEAFKTYAAEHPEAVAGYIEQGKNVGVASARQEFKDILTAVDGDEKTAVKAFISGQDPEQAKATFEAVKSARAESEAERAKAESALAAQAKEIERLRFEASGQRPLGSGKPDTGQPGGDADSDPAAIAKSEWAANADGLQKQFTSEAVYVAWRKADLAGKSRILGVKAK
jgi:signal peptide peptidase SppA